MKKFIIGIILIIIDLLLIVACLTCLIVGSVLYKNAQEYQAPIINSLFALGFVGVGCFVSTPLITAGICFMLKD